MMQYGLIGHPLSHSFSKPYFEKKFGSLGLADHHYSNYDLADLSALRQTIRQHRLLGFNVTIPYKESIVGMLDELQGTAAAIGAVNCVKVNWHAVDQFTLTGYNTDAYGFAQSIKPFLEPVHQKALVLGTGGASKAVAYALRQVGVEVYAVTRVKRDQPDSFTYSELNEYILNAFKLIVNTTPVGMYPHVDGSPEIPYQYLGPAHLLYDVIYNPAETLFLKQGKAQGATTINGLNMLQLQADKSWEIWTGSVTG